MCTETAVTNVLVWKSDSSRSSLSSGEKGPSYSTEHRLNPGEGTWSPVRCLLVMSRIEVVLLHLL